MLTQPDTMKRQHQTRSQSDRSQNVFRFGDAVKEAVESYIHEMGDQPLKRSLRTRGVGD
ncbi:MAG: hypothetical protein U5O39_08640 [Gammaproteobacteria bacterium]|nr:hypothetical protein [Gammaproteobacteria bacterium]